MAEISQLRAAREAAGLTVEQVSNKTNIRAGVILDLEKNSVEVCGGIAYARGHIRSIARVIKADGDVLVAALEASQNIDSTKIIDRLYANNAADRPKEKKKIKFSGLALGAVSILVIGFVLTIVLGIGNKPSSKIEIVASQTPSPSATSTASSMGGVNLVFTGVSGKTWIGIVDEDGNQVFDGQVKSGEIKSISNAKSLKVTIGNAAAVKVSLNGSDLGVAGGYGEVVHVKYTSSGAIKE